MSTIANWVEGARLRTLPAALSPVIAGSGAAAWLGSFRPGMAVLCLIVALALQVGVNFANDYSDGIRGTDDDRRVGPLRLVGSGAASPRTVKLAAFGCFGIAALAGLALVVWSGYWWFLVVGAAGILAAWYYTGGEHPYGYLGLGEVFVFLFFGLVAVVGTTVVQTGQAPAFVWVTATGIGVVACAVLVANNLRDIVGDREVGKKTLATRMGDCGSRWFFVVLCALAGMSVVIAAGLTSWWALLGLAVVPTLARPVHAIVTGATGVDLIVVLKLTGIAQLAMAVGLAAGWFAIA